MSIQTSKKFVAVGILNGLATAAYVFLVALLMNNIERVFDQNESELAGASAMLLLFVMSAAIVGSLVLGRPIVLFLSNQRRTAFAMFGTTLATLLVLVLSIFLVLILT